jgi:hypothetical protein
MPSADSIWPLSSGEVWPLSREGDFSETNPSLDGPSDPSVADRGHLNWVGSGCPLCDENAAASPIGYDEEWPNPGPPCHTGCDCSVEWEWNDDAAVPEADPQLTSFLSDVPFTGDTVDLAAWSDGTPEQQAMVNFTNYWTGSTGQTGNVRNLIMRPDDPNNVSSPGLEAAARWLSNALDNAPSVDQTLYRGVAVEGSDVAALFDAMKEGDTIDMGPSSFSLDRKIAKGYVQKGVLFEVEPGALGVPIGDVSLFADEKEVVSGGRFVVEDIDRSDPITVVKLKQVT